MNSLGKNVSINSYNALPDYKNVSNWCFPFCVSNAIYVTINLSAA